MSAADLGAAFAVSGFLASALEPIIELRRHRPAQSDLVLGRSFIHEFAPISHLAAAITAAPLSELSRMQTTAAHTVATIAALMGASFKPDDVRTFARTTLNAITGFAQREGAAAKVHHIEHSIYRAFDALDDAFAIDYRHEREMRSSPEATERLYEGAGLGVQTSYMTLLIALENLRLRDGASVIDLGSGYGRMGFVVGALRPDIHFAGYEFVAHRVDAANASARHAGIADRVHFTTQDLSRTDFQIPAADVYYLYDPFTEETYRHVFSQLRDLGRTRPIAIVTKGRAGAWLERALIPAEWSVDRTLDLGTLGIFRSRP